MLLLDLAWGRESNNDVIYIFIRRHLLQVSLTIINSAEGQEDIKYPGGTSAFTLRVVDHIITHNMIYADICCMIDVLY